MGVDLRIWYERLFMPDWTVDRNVYSFMTQWIPQEYAAGLLAKSWEETDPQTVVVTLRQGVHWQNKPPVNGREFTAEDVKFNYDRMLGIGSGFTEPNPFYGGGLANVASVTATGTYTVEFKFKQASALNFDALLFKSSFGLIAPECYQQGDLENWQSVVGTGPWLSTDCVPGVSVTYSRNPDYWGYDERHPKNKLPYADTFRSLAIDDMSTAVAAMRTGKIETLIEFNGPSLPTVQSLAKNSPEIQQAFWPRSGFQLIPRNDKEPFTDIRVRKAMQLALNLKDIAQSHYRGTVAGTPSGFMHPLLKDWTTPYDQWPADLQEEYSYNPTKSKELLAEAGYPNGFKTTCVFGDAFDLELLQIIKSYLKEIGVELEIQTYDMPTLNSVIVSGNYEVHYSTEDGMLDGPSSFQIRTTGNFRNYAHCSDPTYDDMYNKMMAASSLDEAKELGREMDMYILRQHWTIDTIPFGNPILWQPWLKGYSGEEVDWDIGMYYARLWIDQSMKTSMGR
jgi:peptide/nickel transport system substrate-binding protein